VPQANEGDAPVRTGGLVHGLEAAYRSFEDAESNGDMHIEPKVSHSMIEYIYAPYNSALIYSINSTRNQHGKA